MHLCGRCRHFQHVIHDYLLYSAAKSGWTIFEGLVSSFVQHCIASIGLHYSYNVLYNSSSILLQYTIHVNLVLNYAYKFEKPSLSWMVKKIYLLRKKATTGL